MIYLMVLHLASNKIIQLYNRDDPTLTSLTKMVETDKPSSFVGLKESGLEIVVGFHSKKNATEIVKLPASVGSVISFNSVMSYYDLKWNTPVKCQKKGIPLAYVTDSDNSICFDYNENSRIGGSHTNKNQNEFVVGLETCH